VLELAAEPSSEPEPVPEVEEESELPSIEETQIASEPTPLQDDEPRVEAAAEKLDQSPHNDSSPAQTNTALIEEPLAPEISEPSQEPLLVSDVTQEPATAAAPPVEQVDASPVTIKILYHQETQPLHHEQVDEQPMIPQAQDEEVPGLGKKWRIWFGVAAAILVGVFLWQMDSMQQEKLGQVKKPVVAEMQPKQKREREPLVLIVPADMKIEIDKYIVKQGDTLWDISKRFTGNPFNYPGIAGENRIPDPDLIFPEQKIIIKNKE
jgi:nucleoid-associated protein YgaU